MARFVQRKDRIPTIMHNPLFYILILLSIMPAARADLLYDNGQVGYWGASIKQDTGLVALVAPFILQQDSVIDRIGIGIASREDPNHVGFKVYLTNTDAGTHIPGKPINSWSIHPVSGAALAYSYIDIAPMNLRAGEAYALLIQPGDPSMSGAVAYSVYGYRGWGTSDSWATNFLLQYSTCIRLYGQAVPEPSTILSLLAIAIGMAGASMRSRKH